MSKLFLPATLLFSIQLLSCAPPGTGSNRAAKNNQGATTVVSIYDGLTEEAKELAGRWSAIKHKDISEVEGVLKNATESEYSVVFVNVDWSLDSVFGRMFFAQFMIDYNKERPDSTLLFHYIDCTNIPLDYKPLTRLPGWENLESQRKGTIGGVGEIIWIGNGRVLKMEPAGIIETSREFIKVTDTLMPNTSR